MELKFELVFKVEIFPVFQDGHRFEVFSKNIKLDQPTVVFHLTMVLNLIYGIDVAFYQLEVVFKLFHVF